MARIVDIPPLPPSGGSVRDAELQMKAQGWSVENGQVRIPDMNPEQESNFQAIASMLGRQGVSWLSQMADSAASAMVAREHVEFQGKWNDYQLEMQKMKVAAEQSGDFYSLPQQMMDSYTSFREKYKKDRGDSRYNIVAPLFDKHEKYVMSEVYLTETQTAKAAAAKYLNNLKSDQLLKLRENPSSLPLTLKAMDPKLFQVGNMGVEEAQKEYFDTQKLYIKEALATEGVRDPTSALKTLEDVQGYMSAQEYAKHRKQLQTAERQLENRQKQKMSRVEMAQAVIDAANTEGVVPMTSDLKRNADMLESIWGVEFEPADSIKKDDVYIKIGYVPPLYSNRLYNSMLHGDEETRGPAAESLIRLSNSLPPWSKDLPEEAVDLAFAYNEISSMGNLTSNEELIKRFNKYVSLTSAERHDIASITTNHMNQENVSKRDSFQEARAQIFTQPGVLWGENPIKDELFPESLTAYELTKFNVDLAKRMQAYTALGFSPSVAEQQAILRIRPNWGTSYGLGGDAYPTYAPLESIMQADTPRKREAMQKYIYNAIKDLPRPNNEAFPKKKDLRIVFDSGEGNSAMYNILYRDPDYDQWLPYMVMEGGHESVLSISVAELRSQLLGAK